MFPDILENHLRRRQNLDFRTRFRSIDMEFAEMKPIIGFLYNREAEYLTRIQSEKV